MEDVLEKIREFADKSHGEQMRKYSPDRYIVHPMRVMTICRGVTDKLPILAAALLHDVLEDTPVTKKELKEFLVTVMDEPSASETLQLVTELTDIYVKADYPQLNRKERKSRELERLCATSSDSQTIKYADIMDNCSEIVQHDRHFARIFLHECRNILFKLNKGNKSLHKAAMESVEKGIRELRS